MYITDDPIADFNCYQYDLEKRLETLPICSCCGEKIQDEFLYQIYDELICEQCLTEFRKFTDDFVIDRYE